jgi:hypothetical protein
MMQSGSQSPASTANPALLSVYGTAMRYSRAILDGRPKYRTKSDWALEAAQLGYHVFPIGGLQKNNWERRATRDASQIRKWWGGRKEPNIGAACGPSGITVLDVFLTTHPAAKEQLSWFEALYGQFPRSRIVKTPDGIQLHMLGATPSRLLLHASRFEIKSVNSYILLPGSNTEMDSFPAEEISIPKGGDYAWHKLGDLEPLPDWMKEIQPEQSPEGHASNGRSK